MTHEIVYVPGLAEMHWYGCFYARRRYVYVPYPQADVDEIDCDVCGLVMGSSS